MLVLQVGDLDAAFGSDKLESVRDMVFDPGGSVTFDNAHVGVGFRHTVSREQGSGLRPFFNDLGA